MPYIFIFGIFAASLMISLMFYVLPSLRNKVKELLRDKFAKMKWNGVMRSITVSYLKICIGLSLLF